MQKVLAVLAAILFVGCSAAPTYNWSAERATGYLVGPGDVLKVNVWKHDELSQQVPVRPDGAISLPLVGDLPAQGRSVDQIGAEIGERLKRFYQDQAPVTVQVVEVHSYKVYVVGEVNKAGEYAPTSQITILHSLALAGGFTRFANPDRIVVIRRDARGERRIPFDYSAVVDRGDLQQNLALQSGDTVIVP